MKTITFEKDLSFSRTKFKDENDFLIYILKNHRIKDKKIDFWLLSEQEKSSWILDKLKKAKSWKIHFNNI